MYIRGQTYKNMYIITGDLQMLIKTTCVSARHFRLIHIPAACPFISLLTNTKYLRCDEKIFMEITLEKP